MSRSAADAATPMRVLPHVGEYIRFGVFDDHGAPILIRVERARYLVMGLPGQPMELTARNMSHRPVSIRVSLRARTSSAHPLRVRSRKIGPDGRLVLAPGGTANFSNTVGGRAAFPLAPREQVMGYIGVYLWTAGKSHADVSPAEQFTLLCHPGAN